MAKFEQILWEHFGNTVLVSYDQLLCLAFLCGWRFLNKISLDWLLTLTCQPSTSKLFDNPGYIGGLFKKPSLFSMFLNLAGFIYWQFILRLSSLWKNLSSGFLNNAKFVGVDQIMCKNCNKSSWMQVNKILLTRDRPEQFPSFFVCSFQWNQTTMRWSRVSKAYHFLKNLANCVDSMLFHCFYDA